MARRDSTPMNDPIPLANFRTKLNAEVAGGLLSQHDIPYVIQSQEGMLHGPISPGATILVAAGAADRARTLLADAGMLDDV